MHTTATKGKFVSADGSKVKCLTRYVYCRQARFNFSQLALLGKYLEGFCTTRIYKNHAESSLRRVQGIFRNFQKAIVVPISKPYKMKFCILASIAHLAALGVAANSEEVEFLTALVSDYDDHRKQYVDYIRTATSYPQDLVRLATQVITYTDDSYTTLLDDDDINVTELMSYASQLPWYTRIEAHVDGSGSSGASGSSGSTTSASGGSSSSTSSQDSAGKYIAPVGALLGGAALLLL